MLTDADWAGRQMLGGAGEEEVGGDGGGCCWSGCGVSVQNVHCGLTAPTRLHPSWTWQLLGPMGVCWHTPVSL